MPRPDHPALLAALHVVAYGLADLAAAQGLPTPSALAVAFAAPAIWISVVDLRRMIVPDLAALALAAGGLAWAWQANALWLGVAGAVLWGGLFWAAATLFERVRGHPGLGFGDVKLVAALGLWLGPTGTSLAVLGAAVSGIGAMTLLRLAGRTDLAMREQAIAFGPFLCLSGWAVWCAGGGT